MPAKYKIPLFPKTIRDEILNYTDDKSHKSLIRLFDSPTTVKILAGGKGTGKSFAFPCEAVYRLLNNPNYNCVIARNLTKDIKRTIKKTLQRFLSYLEWAYNINLTPFFDIFDTGAIFKPTKQEIIFANFQQPGSFAGFDTAKYSFTIYDVFFDEIMQKRSEFTGLSESEIERFYDEQKENFEYIKQSTILRHSADVNDKLTKRLIFSMNLWETNHWIVKDYFNEVLPLGPQNYSELESKHFIYKEDLQKDVSIMRLSKYYIPHDKIDEQQKAYYEQLKAENYNLYVVTVLGDAYLTEEAALSRPFYHLIKNEYDGVKEELLVNKANIDPNRYLLIVDGFDPGLVDKNGFVRIGLTNDFKIEVLETAEIKASQFKQFKRLNSLDFVLSKIQMLNESYGFESSVLAIDSKDDTILELALKTVYERNWPIYPTKAIKNKNPNFEIAFDIKNRMLFLQDCFTKNLISFFPQTIPLLEYLAEVRLKEDLTTRDEKHNPQNYDLINAFEYALSIVYKQVLMYATVTN